MSGPCALPTRLLPSTPLAVVVDGQLVPSAEATAPIWQPGAALGLGIFETLAVVAGKPRNPNAHWQRLAASATQLGLAAPDYGVIVDATQRVLGQVASAPWLRLRWQLWLDAKPAASTTDVGPPRTRWAVWVSSATAPVRQVTLASVDWQQPKRAAPLCKSTAYFDQAMAMALANQAGADEAVRLFPDDTVAEGAAVNLFMVSAGTLLTPPTAGILPGVTRAATISLAAAMGISTVERPLTLAEFRAADEWLVTSALRGPTAVSHFDGVQARTRQIADRLHAAYWCQND